MPRVSYKFYMRNGTMAKMDNDDDYDDAIDDEETTHRVRDKNKRSNAYASGQTVAVAAVAETTGRTSF